PAPPPGGGPPGVRVTGGGQVPGEHRQADHAEGVERLGHPGRDRPLGGRGPEYRRADRDDERGVEQEAPLPQQEGLEDDESVERSHAGYFFSAKSCFAFAADTSAVRVVAELYFAGTSATTSSCSDPGPFTP